MPISVGITRPALPPPERQSGGRGERSEQPTPGARPLPAAPAAPRAAAILSRSPPVPVSPPHLPESHTGALCSTGRLAGVPSLPAPLFSCSYSLFQLGHRGKNSARKRERG